MWKLFPDPALVKGKVPDEHLVGEVEAATSEPPADLSDAGTEDMTKNKGNHSMALLCVLRSPISYLLLSLQVHPTCSRS